MAPLVHAAAVVSAEISPDCGTLATLTDEGVARLWDTATGRYDT